MDVKIEHSGEGDKYDLLIPHVHDGVIRCLQIEADRTVLRFKDTEGAMRELVFRRAAKSVRREGNLDLPIIQCLYAVPLGSSAGFVCSQPTAIEVVLHTGSFHLFFDYEFAKCADLFEMIATLATD